MVSTRLPTFKSSGPFHNPFVTKQKAPFTIGIIVIFMFHSFFNSLARSGYLSFDIFLMFLFSPVLSVFSSGCTVFFSRVAFSFLFQHIPASFFCFIILACFPRFFYLRYPSNFQSWFWLFLLVFLRGSQFSLKLILLLHRLVHLTRLYYSLICKVVLDLFYSFLSEVSSILCFLMMVK